MYDDGWKSPNFRFWFITMKGAFFGLRGKQISLTFLALISGTIFILALDKTSLLATFLPIHTHLLNPFPDIIMGVPANASIHSTPDVHVQVDLAGAAQGEEGPDQEKKIVADSAPRKALVKTHVKEPTPTNEHRAETPSSSLEEQGKPKESVNSDTQKKSTYKTLDSRTRVDSETTVEGKKGSSEEQEKPKESLNGETQTESIDKTPDSRTPVDSGTTDSYGTEKYENSTIDLNENKACNYGKGKWLEDSSRPLYSGLGCKQWLSGMWACRLTQRTDFSYESFRWHPYNCEMPDFEAASFLIRMQDKTIAFIGDSLGRQQFQSLMCMATVGEHRADILDVGREYGLVKARGATRPDGWAYRFPSTNTTILYYWSASLSDLEPINKKDPATDWAMHLDRPPAFLRKYLHKFDVLVLNTGHHWNRGKLNANRWVMYVGGVPNTNRKIAEIDAAKNLTVYSVVKWLDSQLPKHPKLKAFFRTISPRHFFHGDWNTGGSCDNTTPLAGGKEVLQDESSDPVASGAVKGTKVKLLDITAVSQLRDEGHISRYSIKATPGVQDCLHWCLPGVPDTWNELLFAQV